MQLPATLQRIKSTLCGAHQPVNSYLLQTDAGTVLIDPAADCTPDKLRARPDAILITHLQEEHVAGCFHFLGVPVYVPSGSEYLCKGAAAYRQRETTWQPPWEWETRGNFEGHLGGARNERPPKQSLAIVGTVCEGEEVFGLRVLATPGHAKSSVTYLTETEAGRIAFCGDLIYGEGQLWNWFDCDWDYGPQSGQKALLESVKKLDKVRLNLLLPSHGPVITDATGLQTLRARLEKALPVFVADAPAVINFPEKDSPARGWREISPRLHQWKSGNCVVLLSRTGNALLVDDGLCFWQSLPKRATHHWAVIEDLKRALGITKIEMVIPTHYHGDHTESIPDVAAIEGAEVLALDVVADAIEHPERFNLCCPLPWYGAAHEVVKVNRRVTDGARVRWHEYELEIFHLGGQTFYHAGIAAEVDGEKVLFVGDAIGGMSAECEPVLCYNDCEPQTRGWAYAVDRMLEREPDVLVCGHGIAIRNPVPLLRAKQAAWRMRLEQFRELNARGDLRLFFDPFFEGTKQNS